MRDGRGKEAGRRCEGVVWPRSRGVCGGAFGGAARRRGACGLVKQASKQAFNTEYTENHGAARSRAAMRLRGIAARAVS